MQSNRERVGITSVPCLVLLCTLLATVVQAHDMPLPPGTQSSSMEIVGPGVEHYSITTNRPGTHQAIHVLRIERDNPYISIRAAIGKGQVDGSETVTDQIARVSAEGATVLAGVNGDFFIFGPVPGTPIGLHLEQGELISSPIDWPSFGMTVDEQPIIGRTPWTGRVATVNPEGEEQNSVFLTGVNKVRYSNNTVLYTPRFGASTRTDASGVEVVLDGYSGSLAPNTMYDCTVREVHITTGDTPIPRDGMVLSSVSSNQLTLAKLRPGDHVRIRVNLLPPFDHVHNAISGNLILTAQGQRALSPSELANRDRNPRTAAGYNDTYIYLVTVDGRQPGYADGMSYSELADLMLSIGATDAINLDGGGSTTFVVRPAGERHVAIQNRPSDGPERPVANSLQVLSTAPQSPIAHLLVVPHQVQVLQGSSLQFTLKGQDGLYNPAPVDHNRITWSVEGSIGDIDRNGRFTATTPGAGIIVAVLQASDGVVVIGKTEVHVVEHIARLELSPASVVAAPGDLVDYKVSAWDHQNQPIVVAPDALQWSVAEGIGIMQAPGQLLVATGNAEGVVQATQATVTAQARVTIGKAPKLLDNFEDISRWRVNTARASATLSTASRPDPVYAGTHALKLHYDFTTGPSGTAAAYAESIQRIPVDGLPKRIGIWVYGDGKGHWLRGNYIDGAGARRTLDFTDSGGLTWTGWRYVEAEVDPNSPLPLTFERIYVVETNQAKRNSGTLYFDDLRALY